MNKSSNIKLSEKRKTKRFLIAIPIYYVGVFFIYLILFGLTFSQCISGETATKINDIVTGPFLILACLLPILPVISLILTQVEKVLDYFAKNRN